MARTRELSPHSTEPLWTPEQLAEYLGRPEKTLSNWRHLGLGPRYVKLGRAIRYRHGDVDRWLHDLTLGGPDAAA